jgi:hypothetical protein
MAAVAVLGQKVQQSELVALVAVETLMQSRHTTVLLERQIAAVAAVQVQLLDFLLQFLVVGLAVLGL